MFKISMEFIPEAMPNQVVKFSNGCYGVYNYERKTTKAAGMDINQAADYATRLNYNHVWRA